MSGYYTVHTFINGALRGWIAIAVPLPTGAGLCTWRLSNPEGVEEDEPEERDIVRGIATKPPPPTNLNT